MARKFPIDKMPATYDGEALQRTLEDIYGQINGVEDWTSSLVDDLNKRLSEYGEELALNSNYVDEATAGDQAVMPIPTGLETYKLVNIPFVYAKCNPIEVMKYPHVGGFQFFMSPEPDFEPMVESGYQDLTGCADATHATILTVSASLNTEYLATGYYDLRFFADMNLVGKSIINTTTGDTGSISAWSHTAPLSLTTDIAWNDGDGYRILEVPRPKNLVGQGPLAWAFKIVSPTLSSLNKYWDNKTFYCKARCYGRGLPRTRRYGGFCTAESTSDIDSGLAAPTVTANPYFYLNYIFVRWTRGDGPIYHFWNFDHWKLYRTTANSTALCDDDTYVLQDNLKFKQFYDWGYDATKYPDGPEPGVTYYYWVRGYDKDGNGGDLSASDNALLGQASDPVISSITEESTTGFGFTKNYDFVWTCAGGAESYQVKIRRKLNGTYGFYSTPVIVPHTTEYGQDGGEDIQKFTFHGLWVGSTYTFAVRACNNWNITGLNSNWVTQDQAIGDSVAPDAPT